MSEGNVPSVSTEAQNSETADNKKEEMIQSAWDMAIMNMDATTRINPAKAVSDTAKASRVS